MEWKVETVPSKSNKQKSWKKHLFFVGILSASAGERQDPEPDPQVSGTDPRIRIRTKMSRLP
jgi:hypothetical protein